MPVFDSSISLKIGLLGASFDTGNYGVNALAESSLKCLLERWPHAEFVLLASGRSRCSITVQIGQRKLDIPNFPVRFCKNVFMKNHFWILFTTAVFLKIFHFKAIQSFVGRKNHWLKQIFELDFVADITGGDSFSDLYGIRRFVQGSLIKYLWMLYGKPIYFLPQTYGPFQRGWVRQSAKFLLRRAAVIASRDRGGCNSLKQLFAAEPEVLKKIQFVPDVAFVLDPHAVTDPLTETIRRHREAGGVIAGLNISGLLYHGGYTRGNMFNLRGNYPELVNGLVSMFIGELGCLLILTPHVFPMSKAYQVESDLCACKEAFGRLRTEPGAKNIHIADAAYSHNQIKYLIGLCDFFVGSRMHSCIAGLSQRIPTVGIAYSDKFRGVFESIGEAGRVVDARQHVNCDIIDSVKEIFHKREVVREGLLARAPEVQEAVLRHFRGMSYTNNEGFAGRC